jgi:hypothetical protein
MSEITITVRKPSVGERLGVNLGNMALQIAQTTGVQLAKGLLYRVLVPGAEFDIPDFSNYLTTDGLSSPHTAAPLAIAKNNVIMLSEDLSVEVRFWDVKMSVGLSNYIIETPMLGQKGTVKELIQQADPSVSMSGHVIGDYQFSYPFDGVEAVVNLLQTYKRFKVLSKYLEIFNITHLVMRNAEWDQRSARFFNAQPFDFQFVADKEYTFDVV